VAVGSEFRALSSPLLRVADRAVLPCPSCSRRLAAGAAGAAVRWGGAAAGPGED